MSKPTNEFKSCKEELLHYLSIATPEQLLEFVTHPRVIEVIGAEPCTELARGFREEIAKKAAASDANTSSETVEKCSPASFSTSHDTKDL